MMRIKTLADRHEERSPLRARSGASASAVVSDALKQMPLPARPESALIAKCREGLKRRRNEISGREPARP